MIMKQTPEQILQKVKQFFADLTGDPNKPKDVPVTMSKAKLMDGTEVEISELTVGGTVMIAGNPAPIGEHTLEDGTKIKVSDNGVIEEIEAADMPPAPPVVDEMGAKFSAFETATNEKFAAYEQKFANYEAKLSKAEKVIEGLMQLSQTLIESPLAKPDAAVTQPNNFVADKPKDKKADLEQFSKVIFS